MDGHVAAIAPDSAPGAVYVRIASVETGQLLDAHTLDGDRAAVKAWRRMDEGVCRRWLEIHPTDEVHVYLYDGDTGECVKTAIHTRTSLGATDA